MSEYSSYTYEFAPTVVGTEIARAAGLSVTTGLTGTVARSTRDLWAHYEQRAAALLEQGQTAAQVAQRALDELPLLKAAVIAEDAGGARRLLATGAAGGLNALRDVVRAGYARLQRAETEVLNQNAASVLKERGYVLLPRRRTVLDTLFVQARKGETSVTVKLTPATGHFEMDLSGFHGGTCEDEANHIVGSLRRRGIHLQGVVRQRHNRPEGGHLCREADVLLDVACPDQHAPINPVRLPTRI